MKTIKSISYFEGEWLKRKGCSITLHYDTKDTGKRVDIHRWDDSGDVEIKAIIGDGRNENFKELTRVVIKQTERVDYFQTARLIGQKYFGRAT